MSQIPLGLSNKPNVIEWVELKLLFVHHKWYICYHYYSETINIDMFIGESKCHWIADIYHYKTCYLTAAIEIIEKMKTVIYFLCDAWISFAIL